MENSGWPIKNIGDVIKLITKGTTPPKGQGFVEKGINYIKSDAVTYDRSLDRSKFVQIDEGTHEIFKRSQLEENDILYSMAGIYLGKNAIVPKDVLPANTNQALAIIRLDQEVANAKYVSLYLSQNSIVDFVNNMSGQSAQPNINFEEIKSIEIKLPPLPEQKAIASLLSSLDDKIDLLHQQNQTLEALAETLFRRWFIEEAKEDWEEKSLSYFGEIICGKTPSKKKPEYFIGEYPFIKIPDMHGKTFVFETTDTLSEKGFNSQKNKILPEKSINVSCIATVGLVTMNATKAQTNQQINSIIPNEGYRYYIYSQMNNSYELLQAMASGGTATLNLNTGDFSKILIPNPDNKTIKKFNKEVVPIFDKIFENQKQIQTLTKLRDTLLPKLMSGEISVKM